VHGLRVNLALAKTILHAAETVPRTAFGFPLLLAGSGSVWRRKVSLRHFASPLGDLCGFALVSPSYRKVRKGFRKERKAN
jgi:hypothetical protein